MCIGFVGPYLIHGGGIFGDDNIMTKKNIIIFEILTILFGDLLTVPRQIKYIYFSATETIVKVWTRIMIGLINLIPVQPNVVENVMISH